MPFLQIGIRNRVPALLALTLFTTATALHSDETFAPGAVHTIDPGAMACLTSETIINDGPEKTVRMGCTGARSQLFMDSGGTLLPDTINVQASVRRIVQFQIDEGTGGDAASWLPIHIAIPVSWFGRAINDNLDPTDLAAYLAVNSLARLTEGTAGNPAAGGGTISEVPFQGFTHGGPNSCLSVPKGKVSAALTAVKCVVGAFMKDEGVSHVDLVAVVQAGKTYNIEVELAGELFAFNTSTGIPPNPAVLGHPQINFEANQLTGDPFGLSIGNIRVTVGTSVGAELLALQDQIDKLRRDLETHTHRYLTGRGVGHNNTVAITGAAVSSGVEPCLPAGSGPDDPGSRGSRRCR